MALFLCVTGSCLLFFSRSLPRFIYDFFCPVRIYTQEAYILINPSTSEKPVSCNLPECIYVSISSGIPKCIVPLSHCVFVNCLCFRSHKMLQKMIIFDGDDAGFQCGGAGGNGLGYEKVNDAERRVVGDKLKQ